MVPGGGEQAQARGKGSCHCADVIRKWWESVKGLPAPARKFQKGSKVNLLLALIPAKLQKQEGQELKLCLLRPRTPGPWGRDQMQLMGSMQLEAQAWRPGPQGLRGPTFHGEAGPGAGPGDVEAESQSCATATTAGPGPPWVLLSEASSLQQPTLASEPAPLTPTGPAD